jgi:hypothetical protein
MGECNLRTLLNHVNNDREKVPVEYFLGEIQRITGLSKEELRKSDLGDIERKIDMIAYVFESSDPLVAPITVTVSQQKAHRERTMNKILEQDKAKAAKPRGLIGRILRY